ATIVCVIPRLAAATHPLRRATVLRVRDTAANERLPPGLAGPSNPARAQTLSPPRRRARPENFVPRARAPPPDPRPESSSQLRRTAYPPLRPPARVFSPTFRSRRPTIVFERVGRRSMDWEAQRRWRSVRYAAPAR